MEFCLQPDVYSTAGHTTLRGILEDVWLQPGRRGAGTFLLMSAFANFNGGARFYRGFREHVDAGGRITAILSGSANMNLSSQQVAEALLECGAQVHVLNRRRLAHSKCYGFSHEDGDELVVTSGNFTGPGMAHNVEASIRLDAEDTGRIGFAWHEMLDAIHGAGWDMHAIALDDRDGPGWDLLYDEVGRPRDLDLTEAMTMVVLLGHADTARIQAQRGSTAARGTQYFWLSKDCFDFFPPLTIRNQRGIKGTLSALIDARFVDIDQDREVRITYEAENNLDFRFGSGPLRSTRVAAEGDLACISRLTETRYEVRILKQGSVEYGRVLQFATRFIGGQGKRIGFVENDRFQRAAGVRLGA